MALVDNRSCGAAFMLGRPHEGDVWLSTSLRLCFRGATSAAAIDRDELALFDVKTRVAFDLPFVEAAVAQRFAAMFITWFWLFKRYDVAHVICS